MTKPTTQIKPLTLLDALSETKEIIYKLGCAELQFTVFHRPQQKQIELLSTLHCDSVKVICPQFIIDIDTIGRRFARLVISYE